MSTEYHAMAAFGWFIDLDEIHKHFKIKKKREKTVLEGRFDPKTGKKTKPEKVVTQRAGKYFELEGFEPVLYDDFWIHEHTELIENYLESIGIKAGVFTNQARDGMVSGIVIGVNADSRSIDEINVDFGPVGKINLKGTPKIYAVLGVE